jgi:DNA (cytosine-5)-methyltransferase 1
MEQSYVTLTDMFCGAGGSTQGAVAAGTEVKIAANHWQLAIETHNTNFPKTDHDCADINQVDPRRWPTTTGLWASPECTNHSLAKGKKRWNGQGSFVCAQDLDPGEERSRATMWDVPRFAEHHDYRFVITENVVDARKWRLWDAWLHAMRCLDYEYKVCYLNSMFFGVPQSRDRLYVVFWKKGIKAPDLDFRPDAHCPQCDIRVRAVQSFKKPHYPWGRYDHGNGHGQYHYRCPHCAEIAKPYYTPALTAIDWSDPGIRIGDREKEGMRPLKESTLRRIRAGLEKYGDQFLVLETGHSSNRGAGHVKPMTGPLMTQTSRQTQAMALPGSTVIVFRRCADGQSPAEPLTTITAGGVNHGLALPPSALVVCRQNQDVKGVDGPLPTLVASGTNVGLMRAPFLMLNYSPGYSKPVTDALGTITATDHHSLVQAEPFLISYYSRESASHSIGEAMGTISTMPRHALVQHGSKVELEDCYFRMLAPIEISYGMGFVPGYIVLGNKRQQVKQYGNAVTPPVAAWLFGQVLVVL